MEIINHPADAEGAGINANDNPPERSNFNSMAERLQSAMATLQPASAPVETHEVKRLEDVARPVAKPAVPVAPKKPTNPDELETLRTQLKERDAELARVSLERNPKFASHYKSKLEQAENQIIGLLDESRKGLARDLLTLKPDSSIRKALFQDLLNSLDEVQKISFVTSLDKLEGLRNERESALANAQAHLSEFEQHQERERQEQEWQNVQSKKILESKALALAARKLPDSFSLREGDSEHNQHVNESRQLVRDFISGSLSDDAALAMAFSAAEGRRLSKLVPSLEAKISELQDALSHYQQAAPRAGQLPAGHKPQEQPMSFSQRVLSLMPKS